MINLPCSLNTYEKMVESREINLASYRTMKCSCQRLYLSSRLSPTAHFSFSFRIFSISHRPPSISAKPATLRKTK